MSHHGSAKTLCAVAILISMAASSTLFACVKSVRWSHDPPFSVELPGGEIGGLDIDLQREILQRLDCEMTLINLPWARALKELEIGRLDILPGAYRRPEREKYAYFAGPVLVSRNVLFAHVDAVDKWPITRLTELVNTDFKLGAQLGVSYGKDYDLLVQDANYQKKIVYNGKRGNLWRMIEAGRLDGIVADELTGQIELNDLEFSNKIIMTSVIVSDESAEIAFSKQSTTPEFLQKYQAVVDELRKEGGIKAIASKYGIKQH